MNCNDRNQSTAAQQARAVRRRCRGLYRDPNRLCDVLRIEADFGEFAARLTRSTLGGSTNSFCEKIPEIVIALNFLYTESTK